MFQKIMLLGMWINILIIYRSAKFHVEVLIILG
jgi:hypothetical protein